MAQVKLACEGLVNKLVIAHATIFKPVGKVSTFPSRLAHGMGDSGMLAFSVDEAVDQHSHGGLDSDRQ